MFLFVLLNRFVAPYAVKDFITDSINIELREVITKTTVFTSNTIDFQLTNPKVFHGFQIRTLIKCSAYYKVFDSNCPALSSESVQWQKISDELAPANEPLIESASIDTGNKHWEHNGNQCIRWHHAPRYALFAPGDHEDGPAVGDLEDNRETNFEYCGEAIVYKLLDTWSSTDAHRRLPRPWTGHTVFTLKPTAVAPEGDPDEDMEVNGAPWPFDDLPPPGSPASSLGGVTGILEDEFSDSELAPPPDHLMVDPGGVVFPAPPGDRRPPLVPESEESFELAPSDVEDFEGEYFCTPAEQLALLPPLSLSHVSAVFNNNSAPCGHVLRNGELSLKRLSQEHQKLFREADLKEWAEWVSHDAVVITSPSQEAEILNTADPATVIRARVVRRNKNEGRKAADGSDLPFLAKSRLCVQGFLEPERSEQTDAPTLSQTGGHLLLLLAAGLKLKIGSRNLTRTS